MPACIGLVQLVDDLLPLFGRYALKDLVDLGLGAIIAFLGLRGAEIEQEGKAADLPEQLQELRLPVLERVAQHLHQIRAELGRLPVGRLLLGEGEPAEHPMSHQGDEEEAERDPAIAVFLPQGLSAWTAPACC